MRVVETLFYMIEYDSAALILCYNSQNTYIQKIVSKCWD